jgi:hypothetical protein
MKPSVSCGSLVVVLALALSACSKPAADPWTGWTCPVGGPIELRDPAGPR